MTTPPLDELLEQVRDLAKQAGAAILRYYAEGVTVRAKADLSPVTEADEASEAIILPGLAALTPAIPIVAEEAVAAGDVPDISGGRFWLVDPLDGTREFLSRNGEFTVNIALITGRLPILGVVHVPALGLTYAAMGPGTATQERDGGPPEPVTARATPADGAVVVASRSHGNERALEAYLANIRVKSLVKAGSSLKFCRIACGSADLYPRFGRTMEWDTAAGHAVLRAAGGSVETVDGAPLLYGKTGFENPAFIARGRGL